MNNERIEKDYRKLYVTYTDSNGKEWWEPECVLKMLETYCKARERVEVEVIEEDGNIITLETCKCCGRASWKKQPKEEWLIQQQEKEKNEKNST